MAWLCSDRRRVAAVEVATTLRERSRGLLGRDGLDGSILLKPASSVHTMRMRFPIDVAYCDRKLRVLDVVMMAPNRIGRPRLRARAVLEAEAGRMAAWGVKAGSQLAIEEE
jgi:uncharacterized membrane protein (UPF0127 family)